MYFMWTRFGLVADLTSGGECKMFDSSAELADELAYNVTRGTVEGIVELEECSINTEKMCSNLLIGLHFLTLNSHFSRITSPFS